jgi:hypothetical protein
MIRALIATSLAGLLTQSELDKHLFAIAQIETGGRTVLGRQGEVSQWQIMPEVCLAHNYQPAMVHANKPLAERIVIAELQIRIVKFQERVNRTPTVKEVYTLWHKGLAGTVRILKGKQTINADLLQRYENLYNDSTK